MLAQKKVYLNICSLFLFVLIIAGGLAVPHISDAETKGDETLTATGKVVETMNAAGYTYMLVENSLGKNWVAIPETTVEAGQTVTYIQGMTMNNFHSKTLDRTFEKVIFSEGLEGQKFHSMAGAAAKPTDQVEKKGGGSFADAVKQEHQETPQEAVLKDNPQGSGGAVVPKQQLEVEKADGGYTVGEIHAQAKELNGKKVLVRGKIVKINMNIMGKNWVHIQDGTGSPMKNNHDLVLTTKELPKEGGVAVFEGVVAAEKDFGAGYFYEVIVEDAVETGK